MGVFDELDREAAASAAASKRAEEERALTYSLTAQQKRAMNECQVVIDEFLERMGKKNYPHLSKPISASGTKSGVKTKVIYGRGERLTLHGWEPMAAWGGRWSENFIIRVDGTWKIWARSQDLESSLDYWEYGRDRRGFFVAGLRGEMAPQRDGLVQIAYEQICRFDA